MFEGKKMKFKYVKQHDSKDCGVACLATICRSYGLKLPLVKFRELTKSDQMGTSLLGLSEAGKSLGFECNALNGSFQELLVGINKNDIPLPFIAHIIKNDNYQHFVVVYKIEEKKITLADPAIGIVEESLTEFQKKWTGNIVTYKKSKELTIKSEKKTIFTFIIKNNQFKKKMLVTIAIFSCLSTLIGILTTLIYSQMIDGIILKNFVNIPKGIIPDLKKIDSKSLLIVLVATGVFLQFLKLIFDILRENLVGRLTVLFDQTILENYYQHLLSLPFDFFSTKNTGELISRFNDGVKIRTALMSLLVTTTLDAVMIMFGGILMFRLSKKLFLLTVIVAMLFIVVLFFFKEKIEKIEINIMSANAVVTSYLKETISGIETIKIFQLEKHIFARFKKIFRENQKFTYRGTILDNIRYSIITFISTTGTLLIYFFGVQEILNENISIGVLISYATLVTYFLSPFSNIVNLQTELQSASIALDRLGDILYAEIEKSNSKKVKNLDFESVYFDNVSFRYGHNALVLNKVSFFIEKGEKVSIIGSSGSGKTTIAKLLTKLVSKESGQIYFGNSEIEKIAIEDLRASVSLVSQDSFFFNESILDNLKKGNPSLSEEEIQNFCQKYKIDRMITDLPMGYQTLLEEGGNNLSGGQQQLLSIVRAVMKKPDILILDEATSNLDSSSQEHIDRMVKQLKITLVIIAHRLKTVVDSDRIILLESGKIINTGTHQELLKQSFVYQGMIAKQLIV